MGNQNNTFEGHLNSFKDLKAQELAAAWIINKRELSKPLSTITTAFPTYSLHDASHSQTIIETIERLLGNNIRKLSATDTFMLLMAAYTHDLGMFLSYKTIEDKWKTKDFAKKINELENYRDPQIAKAAKLLHETQEKFNSTANNSSNGTMLWALEVKNAVTLLTIELFRGEHAKRSEDYLNNDSEFAKLLANINQYGGLRPTLAKIAYLHCEDFSKVFVLDKEANGYTGTGDMCHPRFVACMIRLGDLLDFDNNRFNNFALAMVKEVPETSLVHYRKHLSTGDETSLISPNEIRVSFNCLQDDVYREAAKWKKMVEQELYNMHAFWPEIVPEELSGNGRNGFRLPSAKQINIKLKYQGKENPNPDLMHLRFDISSKKTFEMLKGGAIYKNPGRVFLREIVQNAMDATKLQIWKDLNAGYYLPFNLHNPDREIKTIDDIKFSDDIPIEVYKKYPINLSVRYIDEKEVIRVVCDDYGTGISEESLIRMTSKVGESRKADKGYEKTIEGMPYFLQPTAAFGLGLQTVFYVADEFTVETAYPGEPPRRIVFHTSADGSYCSIAEENINTHRGTKVIIDIDKDHFGNLVELYEVESYQFNISPVSICYYIPEKIDKYVQETFKQTESIPFYYQSPFLTFHPQKANNEFNHIKDDSCFRVSNKIIDRYIVFRIEETLSGYILEFSFDTSLHSHSNSLVNGHLLYRDIPINDSFHFLGENHVDIIRWNLFCREADTLITISRDKLLSQGRAWCSKTINKLMPNIIKLTHENLLNEYNRLSYDLLQYQYCSLCLIDWQMANPVITNHTPINGITLSSAWVSDNNLEPVLVEDLLNASHFLYTPTYRNRFRRIEFPITTSNSNKGIICWADFVNSIPSIYICTKIECFSITDTNEKKHTRKGFHLNRNADSIIQTVTISKEDIGEINVFTDELLPGLELNNSNDYKTIIVKNTAPTLIYAPPYHCNCWIYPLKYILQYIAEDRDIVLRDDLKQKLETEWIQKLVPDYIVKIIQKHSILDNIPKEEEIYNAYIRLILDSKFGFEKPSEQKK